MQNIATRISLVFAAILLGISVLTPLLAQAQSSDGAASNLQVSPLRTSVTIDPGETKVVPVTIRNLSSNTVTLRAITNDFIAGDDESGQPSIILDENEYAPTHSLKRYLQQIDNVTLAANEEKAIPVTVVVPESAPSGGYYGAVRFVPADAGSAQVAIAPSVASLVLVRVAGDYRESLELKEFSIRQDGSTKAFLTSGEKITTVVRLENKGNVHVEPFGSVFVSKGNKTIYSAAINDTEPRGAILPDSTRKWEVPLENMTDFGKYTVSVTLGYGDANQTIEYERTIWVVPVLYLALAGGALLIVLGIIVAIFLSIRSYKKKLLRQSRRR